MKMFPNVDAGMCIYSIDLERIKEYWNYAKLHLELLEFAPKKAALSCDVFVEACPKAYKALWIFDYLASIVIADSQAISISSRTSVMLASTLIPQQKWML